MNIWKQRSNRWNWQWTILIIHWLCWHLINQNQINMLSCCSTQERGLIAQQQKHTKKHKSQQMHLVNLALQLLEQRISLLFLISKKTSKNPIGKKLIESFMFYSKVKQSWLIVWLCLLRKKRRGFLSSLAWKYKVLFAWIDQRINIILTTFKTFTLCHNHWNISYFKPNLHWQISKQNIPNCFHPFVNIKLTKRYLYTHRKEIAV